MGQRLVVHIMDKQEEIANVYYHWSGYSTSALMRTGIIIACYYEAKKNKKDFLPLLIHVLEKHGGGLVEEDVEVAEELFPNETFEVAINRNEGIVALSEDERAVANGWSEGDIYLHLDTEMVDNAVFLYMDEDDVAEYIHENTEVYNAREEGFNPESFDFSEIGRAITVVGSCDYFLVTNPWTEDSYYLSLIA